MQSDSSFTPATVDERQTVITVEHVFKRYQPPAGVSIRSLAQDLTRVLRNKARTLIERPEARFVLNDISFSLKQGDSLGLVGHNGSGKTTMMKMLAGVSLPTRGRVRVVGRVQPLLALGAGFHGEMTGRENLYLNCTLMGLDIHTTRERIEKIIEFAGVAEYADVAIKRYSSGMLARLGFAAAVNMDPEIILMDEVMAVGDYSFNVRSTAAIQEYVKRGTVVLVSHDMAAIERICQRVIWLDHGNIMMDGRASEVVQAYTQFQQQKVFASAAPAQSADTPAGEREIIVRREQFDADVAVHQVDVLDENGDPCKSFGTPARVTVRVEAEVAQPRADLRFVVSINDTRTRVLLTSIDSQLLATPDFVQGRVLLEATFPPLNLRPREYGISVKVMKTSALKPMYSWDDVSPRFAIAGERRNPRLHYVAPQEDLLFVPGGEMRYVKIEAAPARPAVPAKPVP